MASLRGTTCCGLRELYGLHGNISDLRPIIVEASRLPHYLFSDAKANKNGDKLAKLIEEEKLGTLVCTEYKKNPNSRRLIKVWLFSPDWAKLAALKEDLTSSMYKVVGKPGAVEPGDYVTAVEGSPYTVTVEGTIWKVKSKSGSFLSIKGPGGSYEVSKEYFVKIEPEDAYKF